MTYVIVRNHILQEFVEEVNILLAQGFEPIGGVASVPIQSKHQHAMVQAMISREPQRVISREFKIIEKGIVPGKEGPEYVFIYQYRGQEHTLNLGQGMRNYTDLELRDIALSTS